MRTIRHKVVHTISAIVIINIKPSCWPYKNTIVLIIQLVQLALFSTIYKILSISDLPLLYKDLHIEPNQLQHLIFLSTNYYLSLKMFRQIIEDLFFAQIIYTDIKLLIFRSILRYYPDDHLNTNIARRKLKHRVEIGII